MIGPEHLPEYIECGPNIEPLIPTPYLRIVGVGEVLEQWCEASCTVDGVTYKKGVWCPVPKRF
jgi:hypothetical protein